MPKVLREVERYRGGYPRLVSERVRVPYHDLTSREKRSFLGKVAAWTLVAGLIIGYPGKEVPKSEVVNGAYATAADTYASSTLAERYVQSYIQGQRTQKPQREGGWGLAWLFGNKLQELDILVGQYCLAGTAYDTTTSEITGRARGELSAVAAVRVEGSSVTVHPAGSNVAPLDFQVTEGGSLVPQGFTADTVEAYGCTPGPELAVHDWSQTSAGEYPDKGEMLPLQIG